MMTCRICGSYARERACHTCGAVEIASRVFVAHREAIVIVPHYCLAPSADGQTVRQIVRAAGTGVTKMTYRESNARAFARFDGDGFYAD